MNMKMTPSATSEPHCSAHSRNIRIYPRGGCGRRDRAVACTSGEPAGSSRIADMEKLRIEDGLDGEWFIMLYLGAPPPLGAQTATKGCAR